jgi:heme/copper-type cytochrome/quinol oxidase subunit 1
MPQHFLGLSGMPRRYVDYPDCFYAWNKLRSFGSWITILRVVVFLIIIWEAFVSHRTLIFTYHSRVHLEFRKPRAPLSFHTHMESIKVVY